MDCRDGIITELKDKTVFLTGGSRGIGLCIKKTLENLGTKVIAPSRNELDLSDIRSVEKYISTNKNIKIDIFVHCAGINRLAGVTELDRTVIDEVFQVNLYSAVELIKNFIPHMVQNKYGRIVLISSLYALVSREKRAAYSMSKNAINGLIKTLTLEHAQDNILINSIAPGYVLTEMTKKNLSSKEINLLKENIPTGRLQKEEEIANMVVYLCSELNQSITGQTIVIDGGFTCR